MRYNITPTPSNTPTISPSVTPTNTECPIGCFDVLQPTCCEVKTMSINPVTGDLYVGGDIDQYGGYAIDTVFKLKKNGLIDLTFNYSGTPFTAQKLLALPDGKLLIAGRTNIAMERVLSNGNDDGTFFEVPIARPSGQAVSYSFDLQSTGKIIVGGQFESVSGFSYNRLCRLNANGTLDTTFNIGTGFNSSVLSVVVQPDDKILVAGFFNQYSGTAVSGLVRLNSDGTRDTTFSAASGNQGYAILLLPDGKIMTSRVISSGPSNQRYRIQRLHVDGQIDNTFLPVYFDINTWVSSFELEPTTNKVFATGSFSNINDVSRKGLVKINTNGTIDTSLNIGTGFGTVFFYYPIVVKRKYNGDLYVGGTYDIYNGDSGIKVFTELTPTGEVFECEVGTCYNYQISKLTSAVSGTTQIIDCNGSFRELINNDTQPHKFCATRIINVNNAIISGGTDVATNCCYEFVNIGTYGTSVQIESCSDAQSNFVANVGVPFCAKYLEYNPVINGPNQPIRQTGSCFVVTPTPTATPTMTPSQTGTIPVTPSNTASPTVTPTQTSTPNATPTNTPSVTQTNTPTVTPTFDCVCRNYYVENLTGNVDNIQYVDCAGLIQIYALSGGSATQICACQDSVITVYSTVQDQGSCEIPPFTPTASVTPTSTPTATQTMTPTNTSTIQATPTMTPTPSSTPTCDCLCYTTTYTEIPEGLQVRWRDCQTDTITTQNISSLLQRDNGDGTYTSFICVKQGGSYATPICVQGGLEVTCDPLTWVENGPCCDNLDCDIPCLCINIDTNLSLDIQIDQVYVNGILATVVGGVMPNVPGNGTNLCVYIPAGTYTVQIDYFSSVSGQKISILDSNSLNQCQPISTGPNSMTFYNVVMNNGQCTAITPADGLC